jgi:DNA-directed RNA polymerase subunit omega
LTSRTDRTFEVEIDRMIDELREEAIVNKVGGRFKLSTLIQKRLVALNAGSRPLVNLDTQDKLQIVIQEIIQDKIYLDTDSSLRSVGEHDGAGGPAELDLSAL